MLNISDVNSLDFLLNVVFASPICILISGASLPSDVIMLSTLEFANLVKLFVV